MGVGHHKRAQGHVLVFQKEGNTKTVPLWARLWCSTRGGGERTRQTTKTCPFWACSWCLTRRDGRGRAEHHERALVGMFVVFDARGRAENALNNTNMPCGHVCVVRHDGNGRERAEQAEGQRTCQTRGEGRERARHRKHAPQGVFWCSVGTAVAGRRGGEGRTARCRRVRRLWGESKSVK